ncbi:MAG: hypothetical protein JWN78_67 [Bacteroidota bacterium]|nr:hypothetical protein [Bacteroidota bacterium]
MRKKALFILVFFSFFISFAQNNKDTIKINFEQLNIDCPEERISLKSDFNNFDSIVNWILYAECNSKYSQKANDDIKKFTDRFKDKELTKKYTREKYIQDIYKAIHETFLVSYNLNIPFYKIFEDGTYNCVTASALYAIIFKKLNIDFEIRETPTHVYLVAEPRSLNITIETTAPTFGYIIHDDKFKLSYINYMVENKIIKKEETEKYTTVELFNKYYFTDNAISLKQLMAILYQNKAVESLQKQEYKPALSKLEKSYFIYPAPRVRFYMEVSIKEILQENQNSNKSDIDYIIKLAKYTGSAENTAIIRTLYNDITLTLTEKNPDIDMYKKESERLFAAISDTNLLNDLYYEYYMSMGEHSYYAQNDSQTIAYLNKAQQLFPHNIKIKSLLTDVIKKQLYSFAQFDDPEVAVDTLMKLAKGYPGLLKDLKFQQLITYYYSERTYNIFEKSDKHKIDVYIADFDKSIQDNIYGEVSDQLTSAVYIAAQKYFLKQNNFYLAKEYIKKGLKLSPNNSMLQEKWKLISDSGH